MLNIVNEQPLNIDDRKSILMRSLNAVPFFNLLTYDVVTGTTRDKQYKAKLYVNLDYYLTEIRGNFNDVKIATTTEWNVNIYLADKGISLYGYDKSQPLPTPFVMTDARTTASGVNREYDDKQREFVPFLISKGDEVVSQIVNDGTKTHTADAKVTLCGFNIIPYPYLNTQETELVNRSLAQETVFQTFKFTVDQAGQKTFTIDNDSTPRLILGFGIVHSTADTAKFSTGDVSIYDSTRHLRLTNDQIPIEFLAPCVPECLDVRQYYLPVEYYFMPFGSLRFLVNNTLNGGEGYDFIIWTRTV